MEWNFFTSALAGGGVTATLLLIVGFLGRSQLAHWLNKDLEQMKGRLQQELEAYKVSLIAETERAKAKQAVTTAKALRIADKQFAAIDRLHHAVAPHAARASTFLRVWSVDRNKDFVELNASMRELTEATRNAGIFLTSEQVDVIHALQSAFADAIDACYQLPTLLPEDEINAYEGHLFACQRAANDLIHSYVNEMLEMA
ncbi:MAG: hypothetical protein EON54_13245, partial [Alcaligenaceae bacterium]